MAARRRGRTAAERRAAALRAAETRRRKAQIERPMERARDRLLGYARPAEVVEIPKDDPDADIRYIYVSIFRQKGVKPAKTFSSAEISREVIDRINAKIPGATARKSRWQMAIRLPRKASTLTIARLLENVDFRKMNLRGGTLHLAVGTADGEYLPLSLAFAHANDSKVYAIDQLLQNIESYRSRTAA